MGSMAWQHGRLQTLLPCNSLGLCCPAPVSTHHRGSPAPCILRSRPIALPPAGLPRGGMWQLPRDGCGHGSPRLTGVWLWLQRFLPCGAAVICTGPSGWARALRLGSVNARVLPADS